MIQTLLLAVALNAAAAPAPAAKPAEAAAPAAQPAPSTLSPKEMVEAAQARVKSVEECVDNLTYFRMDEKKKKAELDKEFKGKVPSSFSNLLNLKANRVAKQQAACAKEVTGADKPIDAAMGSLKTMDAGSSEYASSRKTLLALRDRLNAALKTFSTAD